MSTEIKLDVLDVNVKETVYAVTLKQLQEAKFSSEKGRYMLDDCELYNVHFVGQVRNFTDEFVEWTDGTGTIRSPWTLMIGPSSKDWEKTSHTWKERKERQTYLKVYGLLQHNPFASDPMMFQPGSISEVEYEAITLWMLEVIHHHQQRVHMDRKTEITLQEMNNQKRHRVREREETHEEYSRKHDRTRTCLKVEQERAKEKARVKMRKKITEPSEMWQFWVEEDHPHHSARQMRAIIQNRMRATQREEN
jgi:hypothetical protein